MRGKTFIYIGIILVVLAIITIFVPFSDTEQTTTEQAQDNDVEESKETEEIFDPKPDPDAEQVTSYNTDRINKQKETEKQLLDTYNEAEYSMNNPFVTVDPYGVAPLTALVMFETEEPVKIKVTVEGKEENGDIENTYENYQTEHEIPVLGLYPEHENTVTLVATNENGESTTKELSIQTDALPDDFLTTDVVESNSEKMENGLTFIVPSSRYVYAVDDNAEVRWYSTLWNSHIFKRLENGKVLYITKKDGEGQYDELLEMDMLGKVSNSYLITLDGYEDTNLAHHDVIELPNGNFLATTHDVDSGYIEDEMTEIDRKTGETTRNFSFRDILPKEFYEEYEGPGADEGDWLHQNAVWFDESDNTVLASSRSQDIIMKLSYPEGDIKWILGAHENWPEEYEKYLLEPSKNNVKFPGGPHAVMTLPDQDDNKDTTDMMIFDNNIVITRGNDDLSEDYSRAVQYRINEKEKTVKEVWSYGEKRGDSLFSSIVGDADYLQNTKNRLLTSGYIDVEEGMNSRIIEVGNGSPAEVIYEIVISDFESGSHRQAYRAERLPLYPENWSFQLGEE